MARSPRTIITDFRHLHEVDSDEMVAGRSLSAFLAGIVAAASMAADQSRTRLPLRCRCRPGHRACPGNIIISRHAGYREVEWRCSECDFNGVISHWQGSSWDLGAISSDQTAGKAVAAARPQRPTLLGRWRIVEMEAWDTEDLELMGPALIELEKPGGSVRFLAIEGDLDCRYREVGGHQVVEFSWMGTDDGEPAGGRGEAALQADGSLRGRIFIHDGDDSAFVARRGEAPRPSGSRGGGRRVH